MEIYRVKTDSAYQSFLPEDESVWGEDTLIMDCQAKSSDWPSLGVYVFNPKKERGDISHLGPGGFLINSRAYEALRSPIEMAAEALPVRHGKEMLYLINVLECANCINKDGSSFYKNKIGEDIEHMIKSYDFHSRRLPQSSLLKIPETSRGEILCLTEMVDPEDDFKEIVRSKKLTGLKFERLWSSP